MPATKTGLYEGLFLLNPTKINSSIQRATEIVERLLTRAEATTHALYKWDERRMAYEIEKQKRGFYMLAYFECDGSKIAGIERDVHLSEDVMRCLILRGDHIGEVELDLAKKAQEESQTAAKLEAEQPAEPVADADVEDKADDEATVEEASTEADQDAPDESTDEKTE